MAIAGVGTKFRRWNGSSWDDIAEVNSISGPTMTRDFIDTTSLDSTGGYREYIAGFRDAGTIQLTCNFTNAAYDTLLTQFESPDSSNYEIVLPDTGYSSLEFAGLVTELPMEIPTDDKVTFTCTIKITGAVVLESGSGS